MKKATTLFLLILLIYCNCYATTYYVSAAGSDANPGTVGSPLAHSPDQDGYTGTIDLNPTDIVYFRRGDTWTGTVTTTCSGVTYGAYTGTGNYPIFDAGSSSTGRMSCFVVKHSNTIIENIKFKGGKINYNFATTGLTDFYSTRPALIVVAGNNIKAWAFTTGNDTAAINNDDSTAITNVTIRNCYFSDWNKWCITMTYVTNSSVQDNTALPDTNNYVSGGFVEYEAGVSNISITRNLISRCVKNGGINGGILWCGIPSNIYESCPSDPDYPTNKVPTADTYANPELPLIYTDTDGQNYYFNGYDRYYTNRPTLITISRNHFLNNWTIPICVGGSYCNIEYNDIEDTNKGISPMYDYASHTAGFAFYVLGTSSLMNSNVRYNVVHGSKGFNGPYNSAIQNRACGSWWGSFDPCYEGHAVYLECRSYNNEIYGNLVFDNETRGFHCVQSLNNKLFNNTFYNNGYWNRTGSSQIGFGCCDGLEVRNNAVYHTTGDTHAMLMLDNEYNGECTWMPPFVDGNSDIHISNNAFYRQGEASNVATHFKSPSTSYTLANFEDGYTPTHGATVPECNDNVWIDPVFKDVGSSDFTTTNNKLSNLGIDKTYMAGDALIDGSKQSGAYNYLTATPSGTVALKQIGMYDLGAAVLIFVEGIIFDIIGN